MEIHVDGKETRSTCIFPYIKKSTRAWKAIGETNDKMRTSRLTYLSVTNFLGVAISSLDFGRVQTAFPIPYFFLPLLPSFLRLSLRETEPGLRLYPLKGLLNYSRVTSIIQGMPARLTTLLSALTVRHRNVCLGE